MTFASPRDRGPMIAALIKAQSEMGPLVKNASNPHFNSQFADLGETMKVKEVLNANGFAVVQYLRVRPDDITLVTEFIHTSGESIAGDWPVKPERPGPQALGSAVTYARRYSLQTLAALATADDDGNAATGGEMRDAASPDRVAPRRAMNMRKAPVQGPSPLEPDQLTALNIALDELGVGYTRAGIYFDNAKVARDKREAAELRAVGENIVRDAKLAWLSGHLGRKIATSKDVKPGEFPRLIDLAKNGVYPNEWAA